MKSCVPTTFQCMDQNKASPSPCPRKHVWKTRTDHTAFLAIKHFWDFLQYQQATNKYWKGSSYYRAYSVALSTLTLSSAEHYSWRHQDNNFSWKCQSRDLNPGPPGAKGQRNLCTMRPPTFLSLFGRGLFLLLVSRVMRLQPTFCGEQNFPIFELHEWNIHLTYSF